MKFFIIFFMLLVRSLYADLIIDGVTYTHHSGDGTVRQSIHLLLVDPSKVIIELVKAGSTSIDADKVSVVAQKEKAVAAINGGFCKGQGDQFGSPAGILKIKDVWFSDTKSKEPVRGALGWDCTTQVLHIDWIAAEGKVLAVTAESDWNNLDFIVGGTPILVVENSAVKDFDREKIASNFIQDRHPRTAVGFLPNGYWLLVVVDGYEPGVAEGMTLPELATFMQQQGCIRALNLSGGASSVLWLKDVVKNNPGKSIFGVKLCFEKNVSDVIVVKEKK